MNDNSQPEITVLTDQWRARAKELMGNAHETLLPAEIVRLTAMASTLEWAASDLSWFAKCPQMVSVLVAADVEAASDTGG
ncbi:MAG: hypothetical protein ABI885_21880 [Gammaproteobacteria bacterium]